MDGGPEEEETANTHNNNGAKKKETNNCNQFEILKDKVTDLIVFKGDLHANSMQKFHLDQSSGSSPEKQI